MPASSKVPNIARRNRHAAGGSDSRNLAAGAMGAGSNRFSKASPSILSMSETSVSRRCLSARWRPRNAVLLRRPRRKTGSPGGGRLPAPRRSGQAPCASVRTRRSCPVTQSWPRAQSKDGGSRPGSRGGNSRSTPLAGPKVRADDGRQIPGTRLAPGDIAQDQSRFLFHGAAIVRRPNTQPSLDVAVEVANRDARHPPCPPSGGATQARLRCEHYAEGACSPPSGNGVDGDRPGNAAIVTAAGVTILLVSGRDVGPSVRLDRR